VGTADSALAAAKPPALPTREEIEQMDTLVELHARLALHGADFPGRRKAPLRNRLLELLRRRRRAERRRTGRRRGTRRGRRRGCSRR